MSSHDDLLRVGDCAIYLLDIDGVATSWNLAVPHIPGAELEKVTQETALENSLNAGSAAGVTRETLDTALYTGKYEAKILQRRDNGQQFLAYIVIQPIFDAQCRHAGFVELLWDVTSRDLAQEDRYQRWAQLASDVAHDCNDLLRVVFGTLEFLAKRPRSDGQSAKLLENATTAAHRLRLINQCLLRTARQRGDPDSFRQALSEMVALRKVEPGDREG